MKGFTSSPLGSVLLSSPKDTGHLDTHIDFTSYPFLRQLSSFLPENHYIDEIMYHFRLHVSDQSRSEPTPPTSAPSRLRSASASCINADSMEHEDEMLIRPCRSMPDDVHDVHQLSRASSGGFFFKKRRDDEIVNRARAAELCAMLEMTDETSRDMTLNKLSLKNKVAPGFVVGLTPQQAAAAFQRNHGHDNDKKDGLMTSASTLDHIGRLGVSYPTNTVAAAPPARVVTPTASSSALGYVVKEEEDEVGMEVIPLSPVSVVEASSPVAYHASNGNIYRIPNFC